MAIFQNPFNLGPHSELMKTAVERLQERLDSLFRETLWQKEGGKMFGVLRAVDSQGQEQTLYAFSGMLDGQWEVDGFVPPMFEMQRRAAIEVPTEALVKRLHARTLELENSAEIEKLQLALKAVDRRWVEEKNALYEACLQRKEKRQRVRHQTTDVEVLKALALESRNDKEQRKRLDARYRSEKETHERALSRLRRRYMASQRLTRYVCQRVMQQLFDVYEVPNFALERKPLRALFVAHKPPSGAGDCAFPKLLAHALRKGLRPLEGVEFFWGKEPVSGARRSGHFYAPCKDKCAPLLSFMLRGLEVTPRNKLESSTLSYRVLFQDEWLVVVDKPAGLLSVPGKETDDSVLSRLQQQFPNASGPLLLHRLDMETSGLLVAALDSATHKALQKQFLMRHVDKRYVAVLEGVISKKEGRIELPIRGDPNDRPRQIYDPVHGKPSLTEFEVLSIENGMTRVAFFPKTGRTHQLRVHASHPLGLGLPILGDSLYGRVQNRLHLHAERLQFQHPQKGERVEFTSPCPF